MIGIAVAGAAGKMGKRILALGARDQDLKMAGALETGGHPDLGKDAGDLSGAGPLGVPLTADTAAALAKADVLVDFSHHSVAETNLEAALRFKKSLVLGTTGLSAKFLDRLREASAQIAIVQSPNMSVGVNLLFRIAELTAKALNEDYDVEITEVHHRMKKDAPSGTAMKLLEILSEARNRDAGENTVYGRRGETGIRPKGEIGVFALRGGDVVGEHTVSFFGDAERIELTHRASSRDVFALGALRAAKFVANRSAGLYDMRQVLGIA